jgi:hypothetical protein
MAEGMKDYIRSAAIAAGPLVGAAVGAAIGYLIAGPENYRLGIGIGASAGAAAVGVPLAISGTEI